MRNLAGQGLTPAAARGFAVLLAVLYLILAVAYAVRTPLWQAPDEPAHFNYIQHVTQGRGLPVLRSGDYDQEYLEQLKAARFPSALSVERLRYEAHQPPLYYLLAAPVALALRGAPSARKVVGLRLLSVLAGLGLLGITYLMGRTLFPDEPVLTLGILAFVALAPQHVAMTASINNDTLAELILGGVLLGCLWLLQGQEAGALRSKVSGLKLPLGIGVLVGMALLTKVTVYVALLLPAAAVALTRGGRPQASRGSSPFPAPWLLAIYGTALLMSALWFLRNAGVYGGMDVLGLARHAQVVSGQPQVQEWGLPLVQDLNVTLFQSFWVQLGWMGVPAAPGVYQLLAVASGMGVAGFLWRLAQSARGKAAWGGYQARGLLLLGLLLLAVMAQVVVYNLQFLQPQGRYLFPALLPIAVFFVLGVREVVTPRFLGLAFTLLALGLLSLNVYAQVVLIPLL